MEHATENPKIIHCEVVMVAAANAKGAGVRRRHGSRVPGLHVPRTKRVGKGRRTNLPGVVSVAGFRLLMQAVGPSFFLRRSKVDSTELSDLRRFAQF